MLKVGNLSVQKIIKNKYALDCRLAGKTYREIGESLGVSAERARHRVIAARREAGTVERHQAAKTIGDLMLSRSLKDGLKYYGASNMTFDEFIDTTTPRWYKGVEGVGKTFSEELLQALRKKGVPEHKIEAWKKRKGRVFKA